MTLNLRLPPCPPWVGGKVVTLRTPGHGASFRDNVKRRNAPMRPPLRGGVRAGEMSASPNFGALCTVAGTTALGIHSGHTKQSFGIRTGTGHTKSFFGVHGYAPAQSLILTCNARAPVPPCGSEALAADRRARHGPDCAKKFGGGSAPNCKTNPPPRPETFPAEILPPSVGPPDCASGALWPLKGPAYGLAP